MQCVIARWSRRDVSSANDSGFFGREQLTALRRGLPIADRSLKSTISGVIHQRTNQTVAWRGGPADVMYGDQQMCNLWVHLDATTLERRWRHDTADVCANGCGVSTNPVTSSIDWCAPGSKRHSLGKSVVETSKKHGGKKMKTISNKIKRIR